MEMRLGVEGGPADGHEVMVHTDTGLPPGRQILQGARYVLRVWGAAPHEEADWHYRWLQP